MTIFARNVKDGTTAVWAYQNMLTDMDVVHVDLLGPVHGHIFRGAARR
ncbi:MAG: hypothetical protein WB662_10310 [Methyloceanibacter sp.]